MGNLARLTRKNLVLDADDVRELAQLRGTSESEAVRQVVREAVDHARAAVVVMAAIRELHARGGVDDVFGRLDQDPA